MPIISGGVDPTDVVGRRFIAWIVDGFITWIVVSTALVVFGAGDLFSSSSTTITNGQVAAFLVVYLTTLLLWLLIRAVMISQWGWTPGKLMLGLRVVAFDGRPPSSGRAVIRELVNDGGVWVFGCLYMIPALYLAMSTAGHRQIADMAAQTYVIDAVYKGRLVIQFADKVYAGPESVSREEAARLLAGVDDDSVEVPIPPPGHPRTKPFHDRRRDTYVVFNAKQQRWLQFDKRSDSWSPIPELDTSSGSGDERDSAPEDPSGISW